MFRKLVKRIKKAWNGSAAVENRFLAGIKTECMVSGEGDYSGKTNVYYVDNRLNIESTRFPGKFHRTSKVTSLQEDGAGGYLFVTEHHFYHIVPNCK